MTTGEPLNSARSSTRDPGDLGSDVRRPVGRGSIPWNTSTTGPKQAVAGGVVALLLAVGLVVIGGLIVSRTTPTGVLERDGSPGDAVIAVVDVPTGGEAVLAAETTYVVYHLRSEGPVGTVVLPGVWTPSRSRSLALEPAQNHQPAQAAGVIAEPVATLTTTLEAGAHAFEGGGTFTRVGPWTADDERLLIVEDPGSIASAVVSVHIGLAVGGVAVILLVTGGVTWAIRRSNARRAGLR